ncbi:MAG: sigma factor-like helix-turn-helix DNA-binding protein [Trebonia sp.]
MERAPVRNLDAWLTTTVSRLALDALGSARARRERSAGPWLPEPLIERLTDPADDVHRLGADPADRVTLDESVSMALLVVLEALTPAERTAFLLHDVFGLEYDEIADVVGRQVAAVRQLASRARRRVHDGHPRARAVATRSDRARGSELLDAFIRASVDGDLERLVALLDPNVVWRADGGEVRAEPRRARGASQIAMLAASSARHPPRRMLKALVNGAPGLVIRDADGVLSVLALTYDRDRITAVDVIRDPRKLGRAADLLDQDAAGG